jgi:hypothetical protein
MQFDWLLPAAVLLPLAAVPVAALVAGSRRSGDWLGLAVMGAEVVLCLLLVWTVAGNQGFALSIAVAHLPGASLELRLYVDLLSGFFLLLTALAGLAAAFVLAAQDDRSTDSGHQTAAWWGLHGRQSDHLVRFLAAGHARDVFAVGARPASRVGAGDRALYGSGRAGGSTDFLRRCLDCRAGRGRDCGELEPGC